MEHPGAPGPGRAPPLHHLHPHLLLPPHQLLLDVPRGVLPLSPGPFHRQHHQHQTITIDLQVQFPLSLVSIKFKHFLLFGLGGPIVNTLVWFVLRLHDQGTLGGDTEEVLSKWENGTKSFLCLFVEDRKVDVFVMQVMLVNPLDSTEWVVVST